MTTIQFRNEDCFKTIKSFTSMVETRANNPIDTCYEMILKLNEDKMLWL